MDCKEIISDAMFHLLKTKSFKKITVQMILDQCGLSRSTFYRYFRDKYELMNWCYQSYVDMLLSKVYNWKTHGNWEEVLVLIFQFLYDNHEYFENASKVEGKNSFLNFLYDYSYDFYKSVYLKSTHTTALSREAQVALEFTCMGSIYIVKQWLENGRQATVSDMAAWTFQSIPELLKKSL